jgi:hypothetical protein
MSRQYFEDLLAEPPIANLTAVTATVETGLWNVAQYTPIPAGDAKPGRIYRVTAGGIVTFASTGTLTITPRFGTSTGGVTLGASVAQTVPGVVTNAPWILDFTMVVRTVGAPGTNSTVIGTGTFSTNGTGTAGTSVSVNFGGTSGTVDVSVAAGIFIGWTLTVAGSVTPQYCFIQSLN